MRAVQTSACAGQGGKMPGKLTSLRVFIASPDGHEPERKAFRDALDETNHIDAIARGVLFVPVGWEDTLGGIGRPQSIINDEVRTCDYFVVLLRDRWGSPTGGDAHEHTSGTEEEYSVAKQCHRDGTMRNIVILFGDVSPEQLSDPGPQLSKVLDFRRQLEREKEHFFHTYDSPERFAVLLRRYLAKWIRDEENGTEDGLWLPGDRGTSGPDPQTSVPGPDLLGDTAGAPGLAKAWKLANEGELTDAEVEFAKCVVMGHSSRPLNDYARFLSRLGRIDQAQTLLRSAVETAGDQKDDLGLALACGNLGIVLRMRGDLDGSEEMHRKALEIDERLGRLEGMASDYGNLGIVLKTRGNLDGAEEMQRKALEINERLGRPEGMANAFGNLGIVLRMRGDLNGSEKMQRKALEITERLGFREGMAANFGNLGIVLERRGNLDGAEEMQRKALEINERLGLPEGMAANFGNLGIVLHKRGDLDGAEEMHRKALEINERLGRLEGMASDYGNLGIVLKTRGDLDGAEEMYRKEIEVNGRLGYSKGLAKACEALAEVLATRGDFNGAKEMRKRALEAAGRLG